MSIQTNDTFKVPKMEIEKVNRILISQLQKEQNGLSHFEKWTIRTLIIYYSNMSSHFKDDDCVYLTKKEFEQLIIHTKNMSEELRKLH